MIVTDKYNNHVTTSEIETILRYLAPKRIEGTSRYECYNTLSKDLNISLFNVIKTVLTLHEMRIVSYAWSSLSSFTIELSKVKIDDTVLEEIAERSRKCSQEAKAQLEDTMKNAIASPLISDEIEAASQNFIAKQAKMKGQNILKEFEVAKQKRSKVRFPTKDKLETMEKIAMELRTELPHLRNIQPKCWEEPDYEKVFSNYKKLVEKSISENRHALMLLEDFSLLEVDRKRRGIQSNIDHFSSVLNKRKNLLDTAQQRRAASIIAFLQTLQRNFRQVGKKELDRAEQLTREIKNCELELDQFKRDTHDFKSIKESTITIAGRIANHDSSLEDKPPKTVSFVSQWKCNKCGRETDKPSP